MNKISFCDENREKRNAATGSRNTKSPCGAIITKLARILTYILRQKSAGKFFCLPLSYCKSKDSMP